MAECIEPRIQRVRIGKLPPFFLMRRQTNVQANTPQLSDRRRYLLSLNALRWTPRTRQPAKVRRAKRRPLETARC